MSQYIMFDKALESIAEAGPDLRNGLTNHAPMAIEALCALGREDAIMPWLEHYRAGMLPWPATQEPVDPHDWRAALGQIERVSDWRVFFVNELRNASWRDVLNRWVKHLAPAMCASATHGVIRVAHAVRALALDETPVRIAELAAGLGYWAACYQELPTDLSALQHNVACKCCNPIRHRRPVGAAKVYWHHRRLTRATRRISCLCSSHRTSRLHGRGFWACL